MDRPRTAYPIYRTIRSECCRRCPSRQLCKERLLVGGLKLFTVLLLTNKYINSSSIYSVIVNYSPKMTRWKLPHDNETWQKMNENVNVWRNDRAICIRSCVCVYMDYSRAFDSHQIFFFFFYLTNSQTSVQHSLLFSEKLYRVRQRLRWWRNFILGAN